MTKIIASIYPCPFDNQIRHELNAAVYKKGNIYAYEESKITTIKDDGTPLFPERSLFLGLKELNILPENIDLWVLPNPKILNYNSLYLFFHFIKAYNGKKEKFKLWAKKKIVFIKHHNLHTHLAIKSSGFKKGVYFNIDGGGDLGDERHTTWGKFSNNKIKEFKNLKGLNSLANFHSFITEFCNFRSENGKVSGLAAYGKIVPELKSSLNKIITINNSGITFERKRYNLTKPNLNKIDIDNYSRTKILRGEISKTNIFNICKGFLIQDVAATAEEIISEKIIFFLKKIKKKYFLNYENIVFSGGLFLNVKINNDIEKSNIFKKNFFPMAPSDSGLSLGGIFSQDIKINKLLISKFGVSPLIGPSFNKKEIGKLINSLKLKFTKPKNITKDIAKEIIGQNIIGVFNGRAEFGQRSLGARSILADPRNYFSKAKINQKIKKRDWFMPFAPAVLDKYFKNYFKSNMPSMYMQLAEKINSKLKFKIPSAIHVNNTCRAQYVDKKIFPFFWKVINEFFKITKIPMVLNTSFNRHGISTISSPRQALEHLLEGCVDVLYLEEYKIKLTQNRKIKKRDFDMIRVNEKKFLKDLNLNWLKNNQHNLSNSDKKLFMKNYNCI